MFCKLLDLPYSNQGLMRLGMALGPVDGRDLRREAGRLPDLVDVVEPADPARALLEELVDVLEHKRPSRLMLDVCAVDDHDGLLLETQHGGGRRGLVRRGDTVVGGFRLQRDAYGQVKLEGRLVRCVCDNGQVLHVQHHVDLVAEHGSVEAAVDHCLDGGLVERGTRAFRDAAGSPARLGFGFLAQALDALDLPSARRAAMIQGLLSRFRRERDPSLWGLVNAVTEVARDTESLGIHARLERLAGELAGLAVRDAARRPIQSAKVGDELLSALTDWPVPGADPRDRVALQEFLEAGL